jgi:hypothetical protein
MRAVYLLLILLFSFSLQGKTKDLLFEKGLDEIMQEEYEEAQAVFLQDAKLQPSFSSYYNLGVASGSLEEWSKAKWAFESSLKYRPLSGDAQFNAKFATQKIGENKVWKHPYPWLERVIIGFGATTWTIFVCISSLFLGFLIFNIVSKRKSNTIKWCLRLIVPSILLFVISFYGIYSINEHYNKERYAILKNQKTKFYISPNGVQIKEDIDPAIRLELMKYFKDSTWIQVRSQGKNYLWIESENLYTY